MLGRNKIKLEEFQSRFSLLEDISQYRSQAREKIISTSTQLRQLSADLDELRSNVAKPALIEDNIIPLEVHLQSIRKGVSTLAEFRKKATERYACL